jgi:hypothetical protein
MNEYEHNEIFKITKTAFGKYRKNLQTFVAVNCVFNLLPQSKVYGSRHIFCSSAFIHAENGTDEN